MSIALAARYSSPLSFLHRLLPGWVIRLAFWSSCFAPTFLLAKRIQQEEAMLAEEFGAKWTNYSRTTWRLLPSIW